MTPETTTPDLVTHLDPRNVGMTIQLGKQAADEINQLHRERVATMAAEIQAMKEAIREAYLFITRIKRHELEKDFDDYVSSYGVSQAFAISENACTEILAKLKPFTTP